MMKLSDLLAAARAPVPTAYEIEVGEEVTGPQLIKKEETFQDTGKGWSIDGIARYPLDTTISRLKAGHYLPSVSDRGLNLISVDPKCDELLQLDESTPVEIMKLIEDFWEKEERYRKYGFLWKRGILLHGPPGGGKSCLVQMIARFYIENDGIILYGNNPSLTGSALKRIRSIETKRPILLVWEDIDSVIAREGEHDMLQMLDGDGQVDNVVCIATTNYPERLPDRLLNRPSRFDVVKRIGYPNPTTRRAYFKAKLPMMESEKIEELVKVSENISFAHMKEIMILNTIYEVSAEDASQRVRSLKNRPHSSDPTGNGVGSYV